MAKDGLPKVVQNSFYAKLSKEIDRKGVWWGKRSFTPPPLIREDAVMEEAASPKTKKSHAKADPGSRIDKKEGSHGKLAVIGKRTGS